MITISVTEETRTAEDMAFALREIARKLEEGYRTGVGPDFTLNGEEELEKEN